jgi:hypothetical protein
MEEAACRDRPPRWFTDPTGPEDTRRALATCRNCTVADACLQTALARPAEVDIGIWGGTTEYDRQRIRSGDLSTHRLREFETEAARTPQSREVVRVAPNRDGDPDERLDLPELTLGRDANGDFVDASGRVIATRVPGKQAYFLLIDGELVARTSTLTEARQRAWCAMTAIHNGEARVSHEAIAEADSLPSRSR